MTPSLTNGGPPVDVRVQRVNDDYHECSLRADVIACLDQSTMECLDSLRPQSETEVYDDMYLGR